MRSRLTCVDKKLIERASVKKLSDKEMFSENSNMHFDKREQKHPYREKCIWWNPLLVESQLKYKWQKHESQKRYTWVASPLTETHKLKTLGI